MKLGSITAGALAAGLIFNLSGFAMVHFVLGRSYVEALLALLPAPPGPGTFVRHLLTRFGFGIVAVALYAALLGRFARGLPAAAATAAFLVLAAYVPLALMLEEFGVLGGWRLGVSLVWGAGEALAATLVGAFLYHRLGG